VPHRKPQVRYRFERDLIRKLEAAAKRNNRAVNEEVERRLIESFEFENWREDQERQSLIFRTLLAKKEPTPDDFRKLADDVEVTAERYMQDETFPKEQK
jgi:hypothetical protein